MTVKPKMIDCPDCSRDWGHGYCGVCGGMGKIPIREEETIPEVEVKASTGYVKKLTLGLVNKWAKPKGYTAELHQDDVGEWIIVRLIIPRWCWRGKRIKLADIRLSEEGKQKYVCVYGDYMDVEQGKELARVLGLTEITLF